MVRYPDSYRHHKHLALLIALVGMSILQPLVHGLVGGLVVYDAFLTLLLLAVFGIVFRPGPERFWALTLGFPAVISRWAAYIVPADQRFTVGLIHHSLVLAFLAFAVCVILRGVFQERVIRSDHVVGTVCGYLLAGIAWGNCYMLAELLNPNSFKILPEIAWQMAEEHSRAFLFNYLSLSTLTGTGYGDIVPVRPLVSSLTWMEAAFGQFYIAIVVAQLVGLKLAQALNQRTN